MRQSRNSGAVAGSDAADLTPSSSLRQTNTKPTSTLTRRGSPATLPSGLLGATGLNVYESRRVLSAELRHALSDEFIIVSNPDHPLLLRGPDLLAGGRGGLTAIMCVTATERAQPQMAVARFALSRMALPTHARFVLAAEDDDAEVVRVLEADVAAVVSLRNPRERTEMISISANPLRIPQRPIPEKLRAQVHERFATTYRISKALRRRQRRLSVMSPESSVGWSERTADIRKVGSQPREYAALTLTGSQRSFNVDDGVPYPTGAPSAPVIAERVPVAPGDPDKYLRATAFSGWALLGGDPGNLNYLIGVLDRRTRFQ